MMKKLEQLVDVAIVVMEMYAVKLKNEMEGTAPKERKARAPKAQPVVAEAAPSVPAAPQAQAQAPTPQAPAPQAPQTVDNLGLDLGAEEPIPQAPQAPKELTEEEVAKKVEEVTLQFVTIFKNAKPVDGKTWAINMMQTDPRFKVETLKKLTYSQKLLWIAEMEGKIQGKK